MQIQKRAMRTRGFRALLAMAMAALLALAFAACAEEDGMLRVLLTRLGAPSEIEMRADCDYVLQGDDALRIPAGTTIRVAARDGRLTLTAGDESRALGQTASLCRVGAGASGMAFAAPTLSNVFCGDLALTANESVVSAVLDIYIEDYLYGVVGYEMAPGSAAEALKAQAVAARSYALTRKASRAGAAYDVADMDGCQSFKGYNGSESYAAVLAAVDATRGEVLTYGGDVAACHYSASNGGQTESAAHAMGTALDYSGVKDDPFDLEGGGTQKSAFIRKDAEGLDESLRQALLDGMAGQLADAGIAREGVAINFIESVTASDPAYESPSRVYRALNFRVNVTGRTASGEARGATVNVAVPTYGGIEQWYELDINEADNETVYVDETDRAYEITFRRSGSGVGMSQRGAQAMAANHDESCANILAYYYPGTTLATLALSDGVRARDDIAAGDSTGTPAIEEASEYPASEGFSALISAPSDVPTEASEQAVPANTAGTDAAGETASDAETNGVQQIAFSGQAASAQEAASAQQAASAQRTEDVPPPAFVEDAASQDAGAPAPDEGVRTVVATARTSVKSTLYQQASADSAVTATLASGAAVEVYGVEGEWVRAGSGDCQGYINASHLRAFSLPGTTVQRIAEGVTVQVRNDGASLMQLPAGTAKTLATLAKGTQLQLYAYTSNWALVDMQDNTTGFMRLNELSIVGAAQAEAAAETDGGAFRFPDGEIYAQLTQNASLYSENSESAQVRDVLIQGSTVRVTAYNDAWAAVLTDAGASGYVRRGALALIAGEENPGAEEDVGDGGPPVRVEGEFYAYVDADSAAVYQSYSEDAAITGTLARGEKVQVLVYNARWAGVRAGGVSGYVRVSALTLQAPETIDGGAVTWVEGEMYAVAKEILVVVYRGWSVDSEVVATLSKGDRVRVKAYNSRWACVTAGGVTGFVLVSGMQVESAAQETTQDEVIYVNIAGVTTEATPVYDNAALAGAPLGTLNAGTTVTVLAYDKGRALAYIELGGRRGYTALKSLRAQ